MTELGTVAFDIETTGFAVNDQLTVVRFDADIALVSSSYRWSIMFG